MEWKYTVTESGDGGNLVRTPFTSFKDAVTYVLETYPGARLDPEDENGFIPPDGHYYFEGSDFVRWVEIKEDGRL